MHKHLWPLRVTLVQFSFAFSSRCFTSFKPFWTCRCLDLLRSKITLEGSVLAVLFQFAPGARRLLRNIAQLLIISCRNFSPPISTCELCFKGGMFPSAERMIKKLFKQYSVIMKASSLYVVAASGSACAYPVMLVKTALLLVGLFAEPSRGWQWTRTRAERRPVTVIAQK